jgi:hypothetical protein
VVDARTDTAVERHGVWGTTDGKRTCAVGRAVTYARDSLDIFWHGSPSPFLRRLLA